MVIRLKWTYILCFFLVLAALLAGAAVCHSDAKDTAVNTSVFEEQGISEKLLVYLFLDSIHKQTVQFYAPYYTEAHEIAYYFTTVKEMQKIGTDIRITFSISPYLGPHDSIGEDEVTFCQSEWRNYSRKLQTLEKLPLTG